MNSIAEAANVREGWDGYSAPVPNEASIKLAQQAMHSINLLGMDPHGIDPSVMGGINISFFCGDRYADIECGNDGDVCASTCIYGTRGSAKAWTVDDVRQAVGQIRGFLMGRNA